MEPEEASHSGQLARRVLEHVFVAQQQESRLTITSREPTRCVLTPGAIIAALAWQKAADKLLDWIIVADPFAFALGMVFRQGHIPRIANDVDYAPISRVEVLMALDNARPWNTQQVAMANDVNPRDDLVNVGETNLLVRSKKIRNQKARPGVPRFGIGDKKSVIGEDSQITARRF